MALTDDHNNPELREHDERGMQKSYLVLSEEEREKGFVRPVRTEYQHKVCGAITWMATPIAETYARDPFFYNGTWCGGCGTHVSVGEHGEVYWVGTDEKVGT